MRKWSLHHVGKIENLDFELVNLTWARQAAIRENLYWDGWEESRYQQIAMSLMRDLYQ